MSCDSFLAGESDPVVGGQTPFADRGGQRFRGARTPTVTSTRSTIYFLPYTRSYSRASKSALRVAWSAMFMAFQSSRVLFAGGMAAAAREAACTLAIKFHLPSAADMRLPAGLSSGRVVGGVFSCFALVPSKTRSHVSDARQTPLESDSIYINKIKKCQHILA